MTKNKEFNYDEIETGYYDNVFKKKSGIRSAWHHIKFSYVIIRIINIIYYSMARSIILRN